MIRSVKFLGVCFIILFTFSCKNKKSDIGLDVQPDDDILNGLYSDTTTVRAITVLDDSLRSDEVSASYIGSYNDAVFGTVKSSLFFQVLFANNIVNVSLDTVTYGSPQFDSLVLSIPYNAGSYYGSLEQQTFRVYQVTQDMYRDSAYYSYRKFNHDSMNPLGSLTFVPTPADSIDLGGIKYEPAIRIRLDNTFGQNLMNQYGKITFSSNSELVKYLKGLYVKSDNGSQPVSTGALLNVNLASDKTKLIVYHRIKKKDLSADSSITLSLIVNTSSARINHFEHNYTTASTAEVITQLNTPDFTNQKIYLQGLAGLGAKITFPHISNWNKDQQIGINKAELVFKVEPTNGTSLTVPSKLKLFWIDSLGGLNTLDDEDEGVNYFGGSYNSSTQEYRSNITRHTQQIIAGKKSNYGLFLYTDGHELYPNRVILGNGTNTAGSQMRLRLIYTKL